MKAPKVITTIAVVKKTETASEHRAALLELIWVELFIVIKVALSSFRLQESQGYFNLSENL